MSLLDKFPHTVTRQTSTTSLAPLGGNVTSLESAATGVQAWVQSASHREIAEYAKRGQTITHTVYLLPADAADVKPGDVFLVTAGPSFVGDSFDVRSCGERSSGRGVLYSAAVELL